MKRIISIITVFLILFSLIPAENAEALSFDLPKSLKCNSAVLYNQDTDTVVYEKNADEQKNPVQLVQIMTAIVSLKKLKLEEELTIDEALFTQLYNYQAEYPESDYPYNEVNFSGIESGETMKVEALLSAMMLESSSIAAQVLAYWAGQGSIDNFVSKMNETAQEIGCKNTHFANPHGLYDESQYTTAYDMLLMTKYAMTLPGFQKIINEREYQTVTNIHPEGIKFSNANPMMFESDEYYLKGTKGIKTGKSGQTGRCLVAKASQNGSNYLAIILDAPLEVDGEEEFTHVEDAKYLFQWAFENIEDKEIVPATQDITSLKVNFGKGKSTVNLVPKQALTCMWLKTESTANINMEEIIPVYDTLNAPVKKDDVLAVLNVKYGGEVIGTVDLMAIGDVEFSSVKYLSQVFKDYWKSKQLKNAVKIWLILTVVYIVFAIYVINKRAKKRREKRMAQARAGKQ